MSALPAVTPPLDPAFQPAVVFNAAYRAAVQTSGRAATLILAVERANGAVNRFEAPIRDDAAPDTLRYAERLAKFLLWSYGGHTLHVAGPACVCDHLRGTYSRHGARAFDVSIMSKIYAHPFSVRAAAPAALPAANEVTAAVGGSLNGCRIGFDLGASDYKVAAVKDGEVLYSNEFPWNPKDQTDPDYHYTHLCQGLDEAARHLPRVDAIGGSTAGVVVDNQFRVSSLLRAIAPARFNEASSLFVRIGRERKVPIVVLNDGDVSALAGALSLGANGVLGIALGSSEAGGFIDAQGRFQGWLNELAFTPVDYNPLAPADEWSGDRGVGALYFSQQAVNKLLPAAGIPVPADMPLPERLKEVQALMAQGDPRAARIYETMGVYLGYGLAHYAEFYDFRHVLLLGRVMTGDGGGILLQESRRVLETRFPELAARIAVELPDEKSRRVGQAVAAASLPAC